MKVRLTPRATREIRRIDDWWQSHRNKAPLLFREEVNAALRLVAMVPTLGSSYGSFQGKLIRRVQLEKTRHHLYYSIEAEQVVVMTIWGAVRRAPDL